MKSNEKVVHPSLQPYARFYPRFSYSKKNLWLVRRVMGLIPSPRTVAGIPAENIHITAPGGSSSLRLRVYKPVVATAPTPALLWFHGGGFILGKPEQDDAACAQFVRELGITVVSLDYRLAPRHPFPAALDDACAALTWMVSRARELEIDPTRIAVGGRSAGAGLAAAQAQRAHDRKEVQPVFQLLVYPMLDDRTVLRADLDDQINVTWSQQSNRFGWESYLGHPCGESTAPAYSVPARRDDLSGLPPAWIGVGTLDIFHDEDLAYARRLRESGVECEMVLIPGAFHGFDVIDRTLPVVQDFQRSQMAALRKYLFL